MEAGSSAIDAAQRELGEELGLHLPREAFLPLFVYKQAYSNTFHGKPFVNNEFDFVYLVVLAEKRDLAAFQLQAEEVEGVTYMRAGDVRASLSTKDPNFVDAYGVDDKVSERTLTHLTAPTDSNSSSFMLAVMMI